MKELLISWKSVKPIPSGTSAVRRIYRWGSYVGILCKNEWNVEQRISIQDIPVIEECISVSRAAPPATVEDAWEETYVDHGDYQSVEDSLLQIRITSKNYKKQIVTAIALGCPIDNSILRICETMFQPVKEVPVSAMISQVPQIEQVLPALPAPSAPHALPALPVQRVPSQEGRRQEGRRQEGRRQPQGDHRQTPQRSLLPQDGAPREMKSVPSRPNGGAPCGQTVVAPVHRTLSLTPSGWLGTEE
jgi:hypothetical protein